jgi:hypothetical protein
MHRVFFEDTTPSTHACENNVARLFRDAMSVQLQATAVFDGLSVHVPLLVQKTLFVVSLAESTRATAHECMGWLLQVLVCRQSGVLVDAVHTYYPHKGVVNVLDLSSWSSERFEKVWGVWTCIRNAEGGVWDELVVSVRNGHSGSCEGENEADGVCEFVVDTETWENCVVEDAYSNVAS